MFYNRTQQLREIFSKARYETFVPQMVDLLFVRTTVRFLKEVKAEYPNKFSIYTNPGERKDSLKSNGDFGYTRIADEEMNMFIELNSIDSPNVRYGGEDKPKFHAGDRVRVTEGQFKGFEGHVARVGGEKCLAVSISGIAVMLITHVHPKFLEKIDKICGQITR